MTAKTVKLHEHRDGENVTINIETITPAMAAAMLDYNPNNRRIRRNVVLLYARHMERGNWQMNGDAIRISDSGALLDGQHRLSAVVKSGVPLRTVVMRGMSADVQATIDGGAKRQHGDRLQMRGVQNATHVSACLRIMAGLATGEGRLVKVTPSDLDEVLAAHPGIVDVVSTYKKAFLGMDNTLSAYHYIMAYLGHKDRANAMHAVWRNGIPDYSGDPMHLLRERFVARRIDNQYVDRHIALRLMTHAMSKFINYEPLKILRPSDVFTIPGWTIHDLFRKDVT